MHCVVTAGPTAEPLDEVRRLTNASTGALGVGLAGYLLGRGCRVTLLRSRLATAQPGRRGLELVEFTTTAELEAALVGTASGEVSAVFHVAAVSDFTFGRIYDRVRPGWLVLREERKLSTGSRELLVELKPTPKLIARLSAWYPAAWCVGWKFELDGDRRQAIEMGRSQLRRYRTHACVVNGRAYGTGFGLVIGDRACRHCTSAQELYAGLWSGLEEFRAGRPS